MLIKRKKGYWNKSDNRLWAKLWKIEFEKNRKEQKEKEIEKNSEE